VSRPPERHVALVIVSHSPKVAEGVGDMVRQMVGEEVAIAWCGGNPDGGLGSDVARIKAAIEAVWSPRGVAVLVDLGGAETNSEMAIEFLPEAMQDSVAILNAPLVEGAIVAATEASSGSTLAEVKAAAEELAA
jgi:dihydroxyacetone kinase phosphotransfer subunit